MSCFFMGSKGRTSDQGPTRAESAVLLLRGARGSLAVFGARIAGAFWFSRKAPDRNLGLLRQSLRAGFAPHDGLAWEAEKRGKLGLGVAELLAVVSVFRGAHSAELYSG